MFIYKATNKTNGKKYIGQSTIDFETRKYMHHYDATVRSNTYFHRAIRKYGLDGFEWTIICECKTQRELDELERIYIKQEGTLYPNGYNSRYGGQKLWLDGKTIYEWTFLSFSHFDDTPQRNSIWNARCSCGHEEQVIGSVVNWGGYKRCKACSVKYLKSDEYKEKVRNGLKAANQRPEVQKRRKEALAEFASHPEFRAKQREIHLGVKFSQQHKDRISAGIRRYYQETPGAGRANSNRQRGHVVSEETKAKIRESILKHFREHPEARAHLSQKMSRKETQAKLQNARRLNRLKKRE